MILKLLIFLIFFIRKIHKLNCNRFLSLFYIILYYLGNSLCLFYKHFPKLSSILILNFTIYYFCWLFIWSLYQSLQFFEYKLLTIYCVPFYVLLLKFSFIILSGYLSNNLSINFIKFYIIFKWSEYIHLFCHFLKFIFANDALFSN